MKSLILGVTACGLLISGAGFAQTSGTTTAGAVPSGPSRPITGTAAAPAVSGRDNPSVASGNANQAVATTNANAPAPAKGANSFTMAEARSRLEKNGFSNVDGLTKDNDGVWHGSAQKGGSTTAVWLDYKGNVGEGK